MKVLIPEKFSSDGIAVLKKAGVDVTFKDDCTPDELVQLISEYDALIVRSATTVTREVIEAGENLKIIGRAGVGVDNIDIDAATERGIVVCNAPTSNVVSAAEQTMALMLAVLRKTAQADASMKAGKWNRAAFTGLEMKGKTLAVCGLGHVGCLVIERAQAFGMKVIGYDPYCPPERAERMGFELVNDLDEICRRADIITAHLPKTKETTGMFGPEQFMKMKDGVICINTARGGIYNLDAMAAFIENGKIAGAGIDVWEKEPVTTSPLHKFDNVVLTPHLGASTKEAQTRAATQIAEYVVAGMTGRTVPTVVNMARIPEDVVQKLGKHVPDCQKAGEMLAQLAGEGISKIKICVCGKLGEQDPTLLGQAAVAGVISISSEIPINIINAKYWAEHRGIEIETCKNPESSVFSSYIDLIAYTKDGQVSISIADAPGQDSPRIIKIMGNEVDFVPGNYISIMQYKDCPGRMGKIGTQLGNAGISIESMQIANDVETVTAIVCMNLDSMPSEGVKLAIQKEIDPIKSWYIEL